MLRLVLHLLLVAALLFQAIGCSDDAQTCTGCIDARADLLPQRLDLLVARDRPAAFDLLRDRPASAPEASAPYQHEEISAATLHQWISASKLISLIDVREPTEFSGGRIAGAVNLAWTSGVLKTSLAQIAKDKPVVVYCASGNRSNQAATWLADQGRKPVHDMLGGIGAWIAAGYPTVK